jgi:hypothetical protein
MGDKSQDAPMMMDLPQEEEEVDFAHVPFDEEEEEEQQPANGAGAANDDSLLRLSHEGGGADISGLDTSGLSGLDESREEQDAAGSKRAATETPKRKRRKRRKVVIDNDSTELSNEHIRTMLADTSDIVKRQAHPADVDDEDTKDSRAAAAFVPILTQPFLADDGHLHPELAALWKNSFYRALDQPCPFEKRVDEGDVEQVRQAPNQDHNDEEASRSDMEDNVAMPNKEMEEEEEPDDFPAPDFDQEEEEDQVAPAFDDSEQEEDIVHHHMDGDGLGDLGLVNELQIDSEDEDDEENREAVGEHTGTKWHKHTVKVLKLLQSRLRAPEGEDLDEEEEEKPTSLEFGELAKNVNRRTAASFFMECLVRCVACLWLPVYV